MAAEINAAALRVDVTGGDALGAALDSVAREHERIDVLVNNAGSFIEGLIDETSADALRRVLELNTLGCWRASGARPHNMRPGASIVNTALLAGQTGFPGYAALGPS